MIYLMTGWLRSDLLLKGLLIGLLGLPKSHETKDFLVQNGVPYQGLDAESDQETHAA